VWFDLKPKPQFLSSFSADHSTQATESVCRRFRESADEPHKPGNGSRDPFELVISFKLQMVTVTDDFTSLVWCGAVHKVKTRGIRICVFLNADFPAVAKHAAEKGDIGQKHPKKHTSGAKALLILLALLARLKPCPVTKQLFSGFFRSL